MHECDTQKATARQGAEMKASAPSKLTGAASPDGQGGDLATLIARQRSFFQSGRTIPVDFRIAQLRKLKQAIKEDEAAILAALKEDLNKSAFEAFTGEVGFVYQDINDAVARLKSWAKPRRVATPLLIQPSQSRIHPQPKGVVLIVGPWNYPFNLLLSPLVGAISAGNCALLKPSELAPATARVIEALFAKTFDPEYCAVVMGGVAESTALLGHRFDHIFFTGSVPVGRVVMRAAAEYLTPVTLELGGKSPCIVDHDIDVEVTARRIVWGKFYNAGQTCVAPDYLLVHQRVKDDLLAAMGRCISAFFGADPQQSPDFGRIVNGRHFDRLTHLLGEGKIVCGGRHDRSDRYIEPTIVDEIQPGMRLMNEEIFGPILPVLTWSQLDEALQKVRLYPNPLACYVFTRDAAVERRVVDELPFGGGCVNNTLVHLTNPNLPFGGIGESGMGAYHGKASFDVFSHFKSISRASFWPDLKLRYPPYRNRLQLVRRFFMK